MIDIRPLDQDNLDSAILVLDEEFGPDGPDPCDPESFDSYQKWFPASISGDDKSLELLASYGIDYLKYWVVINRASNKVVAVTGIFTEISDLNTAWLGWVNVLKPDGDFGYKWLDVEDAMMRFSASVARSLGKERLALYINEGEECESMSRLIHRHGFKEATRLMKKKWEKDNASIYFRDLGIDVG